MSKKVRIKDFGQKVPLEGVNELVIERVAGIEKYFEAHYEVGGISNIFPIHLSSEELDNSGELKRLTISHQPNLFYLNLTSLKGLEKLEVSHNYNLKFFTLPQDLTQIKELSIMCNNDAVDLKEGDIIELIKGAISGKNNLQKIKINATSYFGIMRALEEPLKDTKFLYMFNKIVAWCDPVSTFGQVELTTREMLDFEEKLIKFISDVNIRKKDGEIEVFSKIYAKFVTTFSYDERRNTDKFSDAIVEYLKKVDLGNVPEGQRRAFAKCYSTNHCYEIFERGNAVCQGLSRAVIMLLKECGISASEVICTMTDGGYHSIVKVSLNNGNSFMFDPTCDVACNGKLRLTTIVTPQLMGKYIKNKVDFNSDDFTSLTPSEGLALSATFMKELNKWIRKTKAENKKKSREEELSL